MATTNRYRVLAKLAVGGMAEIYLVRSATVTGVERYCVLKRILPEYAGDALFVQMFVDEAKLATQLQHPNVASVYDVGVLDGLHFYTMEYVHGETVRSLLARASAQQRSLPLACVLTVVAGAAAGLHHAHVRNANDGRPLGIVHRDVSPSNLMVSYEGNVKLVDFGVAKAANRAAVTKPGTVKGKICYLSPEQCRGEQLDRRSDLFSLGIVMWEMLIGARLYRRASDFESMAVIVNEAAPPPSSLRADIPRAVDAIVSRLLAKSVADRFQTAAEVVEAIENASISVGTTLSAAAVGRLVHDLFGPRAEPWLGLECGREPRTVDAVCADSGPMTLSIDVSASMLDASTATLAPTEIPPVSGFETTLAAPVVIDDSARLAPASRSAPTLIERNAPLATARRAVTWPGYPAIAPTRAPGATPAPVAQWLGVGRQASNSRALKLLAAATVAAGLGLLPHRLRSSEPHETPIATPEQTQAPRAVAAKTVADSAVAAVSSSGSRGELDDRAAAAARGRGAVVESAQPQGAAVLPVPHAADSIAVTIDSDPPGAQVVLDRRVLGTTPFRGELARQAHSVTLVIRLAAYADRLIVAPASRAITRQVRLVRSDPEKPARLDPDRIVNPFD